MDLTRSGGVPVKAGISIADIIGGQFALLGILLALKQREATGRGAFIDLAMQEACAWSTQFGWSKDARSSAHHLVIQCQDAFIVAEASQDEVTKAIGSDAAHLPADKATNRLRAAGLPARRVLNVAEVAEAQQVEARKLILWRSDRDGTEWPLLGSPMQLSTTPSRVETAIGTLGSGNGIAAALIANTTSLTNKKKEKVYV